MAPIYFILIFLILIFFTLQQHQGDAYTPADNYLIACGRSDNETTDSDGRKWTGDGSSAGLNYIGGQPESVQASTDTQNSNLPGTVPYLNSRIFPNPVTYTFSVTPGRHWLRLYFYPFSYQNYDPKNAVVSVKVGSYDLISNLSILNETQALNYAYLKMEYSINVTSNVLQIRFIPGAVANSFAMVNGIELISMPEDLFDDNIMDVYYLSKLKLQISSTTLQTMYRVNMGGNAILATEDDLSREWETDIQFIPSAATGVSDQTNNTIQYGSLSNYTAPQKVYQTDRSMTTDSGVNLNSNLTWMFSVDLGFAYYIKLHFCELYFTNVNQRVFNIYINGQLAQQDYDVLALVKQNTATILEFTTSLDVNISEITVALHPTNDTAPQNFNALLNGLEIFKLNDSNGNLQGPLHHLSTTPSNNSNISTSHSGVTGGLIGGIVGGVAALIVFAIVGLVCVYKCNKKRKDSSSSPKWLPLPLYGDNSHSAINKDSTSSPKSAGAGSYASSAPSTLCRHFTFVEILDMTKNFDESNLLGVGGFGKVYEGTLDDGTKVAVKRGKSDSGQGATEFQTEIEMLSKLRHRHLVSLIGFCEEQGEMILVYEYMANGPLRGHLYGSNVQPLSWKQRLHICIGAARGLHYLHTGSAHGIIHRDVKTTNILLDESLVAKVSDFGLSKIGPTLDQTHVSTAVKGSFGYLDPEYFRRQQLTEKSDVYSFGVVLMEVLCARPVINPSLPRDEINLAEWTIHWHKKGMLDQIMDPHIKGKVNLESFKQFSTTAERCLAERGSDRPTMGDVLWSLEYALQLHESSAEKALDVSNPQIIGMPLSIPEMSDLEDSSDTTDKVITTSSNTSGTTNFLNGDSDASISAAFSQLVNPQGR